MRMPLWRLTLFDSASSIRKCWLSVSKFCPAGGTSSGILQTMTESVCMSSVLQDFAMKVLSPATRSCAPSDEDEALPPCLGQADRRGKPQHFPQRAWGSASRESL